MTVLVLTEPSDVTADSVVDVLNQRGVPVFRCDTAEFPLQLTLDARLSGAGQWVGVLRGEHREVDLATIRSVWYRRPTAFELPPGLSEPEARLAAHEARFGLGGVLGSLDALWVNHPGREADAAYKPAQLAVAAQCGLAVPATLVTNEPQVVRDFATQVRGPLVCKMLGAAAFVEQGGPKIVYTRRLEPGDLVDLEGVTSTAHLFQEFVTSDYAARVTVVGQECFQIGRAHV